MHQARKGPGPAARALPLKPREARTIFAEMVKAEMEAGVLRHSKRRRLLRFAAVMGITEFEAQLMIAQVQTAAPGPQPPQLLTALEVREKLRQAQQYHLTMKKILFASAGAAALNLIIIHWLFY